MKCIKFELFDLNYSLYCSLFQLTRAGDLTSEPFEVILSNLDTPSRSIRFANTISLIASFST